MPKKWFGQSVPDGVTHIEIIHNHMTAGRDVRWLVRGSLEVHSMPFDMTDECVEAVIIAMKLTC